MKLGSLLLGTSILAAAALAPAESTIPVPAVPLPPDIGAIMAVDPRIVTVASGELMPMPELGPFECRLGIVQNSGSTLVGTVEIYNLRTDRAVTLQLTGRLSVRGDSPARIDLSGATGSGMNRTSFRLWGNTFTDEEEDLMNINIQIRMGTDVVNLRAIGEVPPGRLLVEDLTISSIVGAVVRGSGVFFVPYSLVPFATNYTSSLNRYTGAWNFSTASAVGSISFTAAPEEPTSLDSQDVEEPYYRITRCRANAGYGTMNLSPKGLKYKVR